MFFNQFSVEKINKLINKNKKGKNISSHILPLLGRFGDILANKQ